MWMLFITTYWGGFVTDLDISADNITEPALNARTRYNAGNRTNHDGDCGLQVAIPEGLDQMPQTDEPQRLSMHALANPKFAERPQVTVKSNKTLCVRNSLSKARANGSQENQRIRTAHQANIRYTHALELRRIYNSPNSRALQ